MSNRTGLPAIERQYAAFVKADNPHFAVLVDPDNYMKCHVVICPVSEPYVAKDDGVLPAFLFEVELGENFPDSPPKFRALTPNGVYIPNGWICLEFGNFHRSQWNPAFGIKGCARELYNGFIVPPDGGGLGIISVPTSDREKRALAAASQRWNEAHYPHLAEAFALYCAQYPELIVSRAPGKDDAVPLQYYLQWAMRTKQGTEPNADETMRAYAALCGPYWSPGSLLLLAEAAVKRDGVGRKVGGLRDYPAAVLGAVLGDAVWNIEPPTCVAEARDGLGAALVEAGAADTPDDALSAIDRLCANTGISFVALFNSMNESLGLGFDTVA